MSDPANESALTGANTDLKSGPFNVLFKAVQGNTQVLINVRNNHKILGRVKAYDRHMNLWVCRSSFLLFTEYYCLSVCEFYIFGKFAILSCRWWRPGACSCEFPLFNPLYYLTPILLFNFTCNTIIKTIGGCQRNVDRIFQGWQGSKERSIDE